MLPGKRIRGKAKPRCPNNTVMSSGTKEWQTLHDFVEDINSEK